MTHAPLTGSLSCYTSAVLGYLTPEDVHAPRRVAQSVRLALRPAHGALAFSHHAPGLDRLPGGGALRYRGTPSRDDALAGIDRELRARGRVLVAGNAAHLPWAAPGQRDAPHFLLVTGHRDGGWHVSDPFAGLFPNGHEQQPFTGWISEHALSAALTTDDRFSLTQRRRTALAFGSPLPLPPRGTHQWLVREEAEGPRPDDHDVIDAPEQVFADIAAMLHDAFAGTGEPAVLEDLWAAARHHRFQYRALVGERNLDSPAAPLRAVRHADACWADLPKTLRFAAGSARRGRPRTALVDNALHTLAEATAAARSVLAEYGYGVRTPLSL
ncbi:hypothetical protein V1J52_06580 [Streptomyces sp. TRM 70351]|uniref:hypothetical protein n=1 Tax=Streptomyces sp. TRM 70351 TaxID=3116552 RepID=UPI002E7B7615|nr:hypothetical protein [Streptomyces sp. TRM 70351]MEE1927859.1 hypothetical protein [Streptomyces sp. TRM 70351]